MSMRNIVNLTRSNLHRRFNELSNVFAEMKAIHLGLIKENLGQEQIVKMLTDEGDLVVDIFGGSGTTGTACEKLNRKWKTFELDREYVAASSFRFISNVEDSKSMYDALLSNSETIEII